MDCPRCGAKQITLEVRSIATLRKTGAHTVREVFCQCRACTKSTVFKVRGRDGLREMQIDQHDPMKGGAVINELFLFAGHVSPTDELATAAPEGMPADVQMAFEEGAKCVRADCPNAAASMFRLALDLATSPLLPADGEPSPRVRRELGLRLKWLFDNGRLPHELRSLSDSVREDGNDGAHRGSLTSADAQDLEDFAVALFERLFTEPRRLAEASARRAARRQTAQ